MIPTPREIIRKVNLGFLPFARFKENVSRGSHAAGPGWLDICGNCGAAGLHACRAAHLMHTLLLAAAIPLWTHAIIEHDTL